MARLLYLQLPGLTVLALSACSGSENGFFSPVVSTVGTGGASPIGGSLNGETNSSAGAPAPATSSGGATQAANAGSPGSAGSAGSAGRETPSGTSGAAPSGGVNSGGSAGGKTSTAGSGAGGSAGATGQAGATSAAGSGGSIQDLTCSELTKLANQQLDAARGCNLTAKAQQCTGKVANRCNCQVPVQKNDSPEATAYLSTLKLLDGKNCASVCSAAECTPVPDAECRPSSASSASSASSSGSCVASSYDRTP